MFTLCGIFCVRPECECTVVPFTYCVCSYECEEALENRVLAENAQPLADDVTAEELAARLSRRRS